VKWLCSAGNISQIDSNYRMVMLDWGNLIFNREVGASSKEEKAGYYIQALVRYQEAEALLPDDPRPFLYEGLCHERLTDIVQSHEEKQQSLPSARQRYARHSPSASIRPIIARRNHTGPWLRFTLT
jgi:hypothetical protein